MNNQGFIKIALAILLFLCLLDMPYGFYQLARFASLIGFGILAYQTYQQNRQVVMITYGSLALLFQPFLKVSLGRELWNIVDVVIGIGLVLSFCIGKRKNGIDESK